MAKDHVHELGKKMADMVDRDVDLEEIGEFLDERPVKEIREYLERLDKQEKDLKKEVELTKLKLSANGWLQNIVHKYFDWKKAQYDSCPKCGFVISSNSGGGWYCRKCESKWRAHPNKSLEKRWR